MSVYEELVVVGLVGILAAGIASQFLADSEKMTEINQAASMSEEDASRLGAFQLGQTLKEDDIKALEEKFQTEFFETKLFNSSLADQATNTAISDWIDYNDSVKYQLGYSTDNQDRVVHAFYQYSFNDYSLCTKKHAELIAELNKDKFTILNKETNNQVRFYNKSTEHLSSSLLNGRNVLSVSKSCKGQYAIVHVQLHYLNDEMPSDKSADDKSEGLFTKTLELDGVGAQ